MFFVNWIAYHNSMRIENKPLVYETPKMSIVELVLEQAVLSASDPTVTNPDMTWDD